MKGSFFVIALLALFSFGCLGGKAERIILSVDVLPQDIRIGEYRITYYLRDGLCHATVDRFYKRKGVFKPAGEFSRKLDTSFQLDDGAWFGGYCREIVRDNAHSWELHLSVLGKKGD